MAGGSWSDLYRSWTGDCSHPDAPAGGGGPGSFRQQGPLGLASNWDGLPHPQSPAGRFHSHEIVSILFLQRVRALKLTYQRALVLAPAAVYAETGYQLGRLLQGLLPGLLQMLAVLGITTAVGAGAGAAIGLFAGGVGAAPGAVVGAEFGLEIGTAALSWLGLAFLVSAIAKSFGELQSDLTQAIRLSWGAAEKNSIREQRDIELAAEGLAQACAVLFRLILQAILAWVLKNAAVAASRATFATTQSIARIGAQPTADASVAAVAALLRKSRLPAQFVDWIEANWDDLTRNPKLRLATARPAASAAGDSSAASPSRARSADTTASKSSAATPADQPEPIPADKIKAMPKGSRPDPRTYMSDTQIQAQLSHFDDGASRFMTQGSLDKYGPAQSDGTSFVMPKSEADELISSTNGDPRALEQSLGLPDGLLDSQQLVRVDVPDPGALNLRIPSGNEAGANDQWIPGGVLPEGNLEAVIDLGGAPPGSWITTPLN